MFRGKTCFKSAYLEGAAPWDDAPVLQGVLHRAEAVANGVLKWGGNVGVETKNHFEKKMLV